jgi:hypothetical protein
MDEKYQYTPEIRVENLEQHKEGIEDQLRQVQLLFCDKVYSEYKTECRKNNEPIGKTFSDIMEDQRVDYTEDLRMVHRVAGESKLGLDEEYKVVHELFYKNINAIYDDLPETETDYTMPLQIRKRAEVLSEIVKYIEEQKSKAKEAHPEKWQEMTRQNRNETEKSENMAGGLFMFNKLNKRDNPDAKKAEQLLTRDGFSEFDDFLEIHFPSIFKAGKKLGREEIVKALADLANIIIERYPETRAIVGISWLLERKVMDKILPMRKFDKPDELASTNWQQLITEEGQINQDKVQQLFQSGVMPARNIIGYIKVEDFLQKYLPADKQGQIRLKKINPTLDTGFLSLERNAKADGQKFNKAWDAGELDTNEKVTNFLDNLTNLKNVLQQIGFYETFKELLAKNVNRARTEINKENADTFKEIELKYNEFFSNKNSNKYVEYIVDIK